MGRQLEPRTKLLYMLFTVIHTTNYPSILCQGIETSNDSKQLKAEKIIKTNKSHNKQLLLKQRDI